MEEILYSFAVQDDHTDALPDYLRRYPENWRELIELFLEVTKPEEPPRKLDAEDYRMIDESWEMFNKCNENPVS